MHTVTYESSALQKFRTIRVPRGRSSGLTLVRRNPFERHVLPDPKSPIPIVSPFALPTIPPELRTPLSYPGEERLKVQFSETDATDLDMRSYVLESETSVTNSPSGISRLWSLLRLPKFGAQFSRIKMDALIRGDQSGTVLHPFFVCGAEMYGAPFTLGVHDTPAMVLFQARRTQVAWECLAELFKCKDYKANIQAALLVASSYIFVRMTQSALLYIQKSYDFIKMGKLQFIPTYGRPPEFSEDLHEILVALSQTIYWANYLFLACGGPEPRATTELEKEFRQELPVGGVSLSSRVLN